MTTFVTDTLDRLTQPVTGGQRLVLIVLLMLADRGGAVELYPPDDDRLAFYTGLHPSSVRRSLSELRARGLIDVERDDDVVTVTVLL